MTNIYLFDQYGAGGLYSGPGNYFVNMLRANKSHEEKFHLVHGNIEQTNIEVFESVNFINRSNNKFNNLRYSIKVADFVNRNEIDIIQSTHAYMGSISACKAGIEKGIPTFLRIAKSNSELSNRSLTSKIFNISKKKLDVLNRANGVVAISQEIKSELLKLGVSENKIHYIPNGVDIDRFNKPLLPKDFIFPFNGMKVIAFCGAIIPRKRPHLLIEALAMLPEEYAVCLIGPFDESEYVKDLRQLIEKLKLKHRVYFTGYVSNPEFYLYFCSYFCLPSENEGMPNALLEAMASNCIPISTKISGVTDILSDSKYGFIIEPESKYIARIIKETSSEENVYSAAAFDRVKNSFSAKVAYSSYVEMYKQSLL